MNKKEIISKTEDFVKKRFTGESTGHDWWHIYRVWKDAISIGQKEKVDMFIVQIAALLHDIADVKFDQENKGTKEIGDWLLKNKVSKFQIEKIITTIDQVSFKGAMVNDKNISKEASIVQDADRLDAMGAMGIARVFAYGGKIGRPLYDPNIRPKLHKNYESYKREGNSSSINHFYEKLLLLKDRMHTKTAKKMAEKRHQFMEKYLEEFFEEWKGK